MTTTINQTTAIETKGGAKWSAPQVIEARTRYAQSLAEGNPLKIEDLKKLCGIDHMNNQTVEKTLRGIFHGHIDMCGLPYRPFNSRPETAEKIAAKQAEKAAKAAARQLTQKKWMDVTGLADDQVAEVQALVDLLKAAANQQPPETLVDAEYVDMEDRAAAEAAANQQPTEETPVDTDQPAVELEVVEPEVVEPELVADPEAPAAEVEVVETPKGKRNRNGGKKAA